MAENHLPEALQIPNKGTGKTCTTHEDEVNVGRNMERACCKAVQKSHGSTIEENLPYVCMQKMMNYDYPNNTKHEPFFNYGRVSYYC